MRTCAVPARCPFSPTQQYRGSMMPAGNDVIRPRRGSTFTLGLASQSRSFLRFALGSSGRRTSSFHSPACGSGEEKKKSFPPIDASTLAHVPLRGFFFCCSVLVGTYCQFWCRMDGGTTWAVLGIFSSQVSDSMFWKSTYWMIFKVKYYY